MSDDASSSEGDGYNHDEEVLTDWLSVGLHQVAGVSDMTAASLIAGVCVEDFKAHRLRASRRILEADPKFESVLAFGSVSANRNVVWMYIDPMELVDRLRYETRLRRYTPDAFDDDSSPDRFTMLTGADLPPVVTEAIELLLGFPTPIQNEFAKRMQLGFAQTLATYGTAVPLLEQLLLEAREQRGWSHATLSRLTGIGQSTLLEVESGLEPVRIVSERQIAEWIRILDLDFDQAALALNRSLSSYPSAPSENWSHVRRMAKAFASEVGGLLKATQ